MRHVAAVSRLRAPATRARPHLSTTAPTRRRRRDVHAPRRPRANTFLSLRSPARTTTRSSGRDAHEAARIPTSPRREDRACDARRAMRSLSATKDGRTRSTRASIFDGFFSSPIRVFYSILFICALEVRAHRDVGAIGRDASAGADDEPRRIHVPRATRRRRRND